METKLTCLEEIVNILSTIPGEAGLQGRAGSSTPVAARSMSHRRGRRDMNRGVAVVGSWIVLTPLAGLAQEQAVLEEVTVTAQKREQNLQEVGVAVNAFEAEVIRELKI